MRFRAPDEKPVVWIGSSYRDLVAMPANIQKQIGRALYIAQHGDRADFSKPMHGRDLANVMEIVVDDLNRTIRGAYTTAFKDVVYVLDIFVKKSRVEAQPRSETKIESEGVTERQRSTMKRKKETHSDDTQVLVLKGSVFAQLDCRMRTICSVNRDSSMSSATR